MMSSGEFTPVFLGSHEKKPGFQGGRPTASSLEIKFAKCLPFLGGMCFSGRGFHFFFLFLREKVSYIRYHEVFSNVS